MANLATKSASVTSSVIVYGAPKSGKSLLAGELAEHFKLIWVDLENGHETLFQLPEAWQKNIELINLPDTRSYPIAIETCLKMVKGKVDICDAHGKVGCMICKKEEAAFVTTDLPNLSNNTVVVFDSLTQLSNSAIAHITKSKPDDYKLDYDDWGNLGKLLEIFLSHLQQAKYNVVVISHEVEAETEGKKKTLVPVGGTRNFSRNIAKYFGHVVYAERKNKKHVFNSSSTYATTVLAGSRSNIDLDTGDSKPSLLQIFKPDLYTKNSIVTTAAQVSVKASTQSILDRLKKK
jgi:adenosyl cobinamide kinase/adenosyl cobinamide phosphate guanylyltransferase